MYTLRAPTSSITVSITLLNLELSPHSLLLALLCSLSLSIGCDAEAPDGPQGATPPPLAGGGGAGGGEDTAGAEAAAEAGALATDLGRRDQGVVDMELPPPPPLCANGLDDDGDGLADYPSDPGCASAEDPDERDDGPASPVAQCSNGLDDDSDGYVDLSDSDCSDLNDPRERPIEGDAAPACLDGIDNDGDGLIDAFEDPGCSSFGDSDELDLEETPACSNQLDDDRDGLIDFPIDPGCVSIGDLSELDAASGSACRDGLDNDGDGLIDFPADPGCESASSASESPLCLGTARVIEAVQGRSYRVTSEQGRYEREASCGGRGAPDMTLFYRLDRPVRRLTLRSEGDWETTLSARYRCVDGPELACAREPLGDGGQNELILSEPPLGAYYFIIDGVSAAPGEATVWIEETPIEACQDGVDNDGDGFIDAPFDPGCLSPADESEETPSPTPSCGDGLDNDGDGQADYPSDRGCYQASDSSEEDECGLGVLVLPLGGSYPLTLNSTSSTPDQTSELTGSCGLSQGFEAVYVINNPSHARFHFSLKRSDGASDNASLYVRSGDCLSGPELACASGLLEAHQVSEEPNPAEELSLRVESAPQGPLFLVIDHPLDGLPYELKVNREQLPPRCRDGVDNDDDGLVDHEDPGCQSEDDETELDPEEATACHDLIDNDQDGFTDHPYDSGCLYRGGLSELDPELSPACSNGVDDNADGYVDFPYDPNCSSRADPIEAVEAEPAACSNGLDDDGDGLVDFPFDQGCTARGDHSEQQQRWRPQCSDGLDNDGDGELDFPYDAQCAGRGTRSERGPLGLSPVCSNGEDDDLDGATDFPADPGCESRADDSEGDPELLAACSNRFDDDGNGRVDWPDDPGCEYSADPSEEGVPLPRPRCADGVDNDLDGRIDSADLGCSSPRDDEELDEFELAPACADGLDNDGDLLADWPQDYGCASAGDRCEQGGFISCDEQGEAGCVDALSDPAHCGACGLACEAGEACVQGYCGGERPLRADLARCSFTIQDLSLFFTGPLAQGLELVTSCTPHDEVQALLLPRASTISIRRAAGEIRRYVERGGIVISERERSAQLYELLTGRQLPLSAERYGACEGNPMPLLQRSASDPLWALSPHVEIPFAESGCGLDLSLLPGLVDLGGWSPTTSSLSYLDYGLGRAWFVEADWGQSASGESPYAEAGFHLMAAMISGAGVTPRHPLMPACRDGVDNDLDGVSDLWDLDCEGRDDMSEAPNGLSAPEGPTAPNELSPIWERLRALRARAVACYDGLDNDGDGAVDFPYDVGCEAMGDKSEATPDEQPECADGLDNDADGHIDWPQDSGCAGRGATREGEALLSAPCSNERDDDRDGLTDWPADPDCASPQSSGELRHSVAPLELSDALLLSLYTAGAHGLTACGNELDDDADGLVDLEDEACQSKHGLSEGPSLEPVGLAEVEGCEALEAEVEAGLIPSLSSGDSWQGSFASPHEGEPLPLSRCGADAQAVALARYQHSGGRLRVTALDSSEGAPLSLSLWRSCAEGGELTCLGDEGLRALGALELPDARPGSYWLEARALTEPAWLTSDQLELPLDSRGFSARQDLNDRCWQDGGQDAFDCMGLLSVQLGEQSLQLDVSEGSHVISIEGQPFYYQSDFIDPNVWRLRWEPALSPSASASFEELSLSLRGN